MAYLKSIEKKLPDISISIKKANFAQAIKNNVKPGIAGRC